MCITPCSPLRCLRPRLHRAEHVCKHGKALHAGQLIIHRWERREVYVYGGLDRGFRVTMGCVAKWREGGVILEPAKQRSRFICPSVGTSGVARIRHHGYIECDNLTERWLAVSHGSDEGLFQSHGRIHLSSLLCPPMSAPFLYLACYAPLIKLRISCNATVKLMTVQLSAGVRVLSPCRGAGKYLSTESIFSFLQCRY